MFSLVVQNYMCSCCIDLLFLGYVFCIGFFATSVVKVFLGALGALD